MSGFESPAAAFSNSLEGFLLQREQKRRQDLLDAHQIRMDEANLEFRKQEAKDRQLSRDAIEVDRKAKIAEDVKKADDARYAKQVAGKQIGDVFTPDMARLGIKTGNEDDFAPQQPQQFVDGAGAKTQGTTPLAGVMQDQPATQDLVRNNVPIRFVGSPAQREAATKTADQEKYIASLPAGPLKDAALFRLRTGGTEPVGVLKGQGDDTEDVVYESQDRKKLYRVVPGQGLVETTGPFKKGATHYIQAPQPPQPIVIQTSEGPMSWGHGGQAAPIMGPGGEPVEAPLTASTRTMMDGAKQILPQITEVDKLAQELDKRGLFGPVMSRVREAAAKVGTIDENDFDKSSAQLQQFASAFNAAVDADPKLSTDALVGQFSVELGLLASGAGRIHGGARGGGSIQMIDYMKNMLSGNSSYQMFHGRLTGLNTYMAKYAKGPGKKVDNSGGGSSPGDDAYAAYLARTTGAKK